MFVPSIKKWYDEAKRDADKLQLMFADMQEMQRARKELEMIPGLVMTGSLGNNIEINAQGINKGIGMLELGRMLGITREEIMACGDGDNDLEMLKAVGLGVAMGNAEESGRNYRMASNQQYRTFDPGGRVCKAGF